jgi:hypothetical protein
MTFAETVISLFLLDPMIKSHVLCQLNYGPNVTANVTKD